MFKRYDKVRIRYLTDEERYDKPLHYNRKMVRYEGLEGVITHVNKRDYGEIYKVKTKLGDEWKWLPEWLEEPIIYNAF